MQRLKHLAEARAAWCDFKCHHSVVDVQLYYVCQLTLVRDNYKPQEHVLVDRIKLLIFCAIQTGTGLIILMYMLPEEQQTVSLINRLGV